MLAHQSTCGKPHGTVTEGELTTPKGNSTRGLPTTATTTTATTAAAAGSGCFRNGGSPFNNTTCRACAGDCGSRTHRSPQGSRSFFQTPGQMNCTLHPGRTTCDTASVKFMEQRSQLRADTMQWLHQADPGERCQNNLMGSGHVTCNHTRTERLPHG